jgi:hypothetical protein
MDAKTTGHKLPYVIMVNLMFQIRPLGVETGQYLRIGTGRIRPLAISKQLASKTQFNGVG